MRVACVLFSSPTEVEKVAEYFLRFSPQIAIKKDEALFIEVGKCQNIYSEDSFKKRAQVILKRLNLNAQIAIARNISDSLVAARFKTDSFDDLPLEALFDFTNLFESELDGRKQIALLIETMKQVGVRTLERFNKIPIKELASRFGKIALYCRYRISGELEVPWCSWQPPEIISEKTDVTDCDVTGSLTPVTFEIKALLDRIFSRLWSRGLKASSLKVILTTEKGSFNPDPQREFTFNFIAPQSTTKGALSIIMLRLEQGLIKRPINSLVQSIEVVILSHVPGYLAQRNLLHNRDVQEENLNSLISQLIEIHGEANIFRACSIEERVPEKSWRKSTSDNRFGEALGVLTDNAVANAADTDLLVDIIPLRPTYLLKPEKIEVTCDFIYIRKKPFRIKLWSKYVERISSHWLEGRVDRNYYQVEVQSGPKLWIFSDLSRQYYLHGYYS
jgi:hypothetical protein